MQPGLHREEFRQWVGIAEGRSGTARQGAAHELLAEHHMMICVLNALDTEANRIASDGDLRPEFWRDAIDFIGNFVHQCHRVKEEQYLVPAIEREQLIDADFAKALGREHENAKDLTLSICDGYQDGDWEKVMRIVSLYTYLLRPHMDREERLLVGPLLDRASHETAEALAVAFQDVEARALHGRGRRHYLDVARRLCTDLPVDSQPDG